MTQETLLSDWHAAHAALAWQVELGAIDAICDAPQNRYEAPRTQAKPARVDTVAPPEPTAPDPVRQAQSMADASPDLATLRDALAAYPHCDLRQGARNLVFADGRPGARVMIVGEAPGREEDLRGLPFVGDAGQLLDRMFAAIGLRRDHPDAGRALYITNILPWRPPQNRDPSPDECAMMRPFVLRHIELAAPDLVVTMGRVPTAALLDTSDGITRIRGQWRSLLDRPCLPMLHPAYLLRNPIAKRDTWADLLALQARLRMT